MFGTTRERWVAIALILMSLLLALPARSFADAGDALVVWSGTALRNVLRVTGNGDLLPTLTATADLGSASLKYRNAYLAGELYGTTASFDGDVYPVTNGGPSLGSNSKRWGSVYAFGPVNAGGTVQGGSLVSTGALAVKRRVAATDTSLYNSDAILGITDTSAPRSIHATDSKGFYPGQVVVVKDESGAASSAMAIEIYGFGTDTIDGAASTRLTQAYGSKRLYTDGNGHWYSY